MSKQAAHSAEGSRAMSWPANPILGGSIPVSPTLTKLANFFCALSLKCVKISMKISA